MIMDGRDNERFAAYIQLICELESRLCDRASSIRKRQTGIEGLSTENMGARFPSSSFQYSRALNDETIYPIGDEKLMESILPLFDGAVCPGSDMFLLNIHPNPDVLAAAVACLSMYHNIDGLMDEYAGTALLYEQKIAREIGSWAGWQYASGVSTSGGKGTVSYALRAAFAKSYPDYLKKGVPDKTVIIASEGAHYSLAHTVSILGLGVDNCLLVPMGDDFSMDCFQLSNTLNLAWGKGYTVAAVVCCGGSTINFHCDDLTKVFRTICKVREQYPNAAIPHLHVDAVIGWQYLALTEKFVFCSDVSDITKQKISEIQRRLLGVKHFDSFGADFHKNGYCPTSSSFYIEKSGSFMTNLTIGEHIGEVLNASLGQHRPYKYTVENSRNIGGVFSAWTILAKYGRSGLAKALLEFYVTMENFSLAFAQSELFSKYTTKTLGWEVIFEINESVFENFHISKTTRDFVDYCKELTFVGYATPLIGYVKENDKMLIFPNGLVSIDKAKEIVRLLEVCLQEYCQSCELQDGRPFSSVDDPVQ